MEGKVDFIKFYLRETLSTNHGKKGNDDYALCLFLPTPLYIRALCILFNKFVFRDCLSFHRSLSFLSSLSPETMSPISPQLLQLGLFLGAQNHTPTGAL